MVLPVLWPQLTPGHYAFCRTWLLSASASFIASLAGPPGVRHNSFAAQPPDLLLRSYVYPSGFGLYGILAHRLALYPVSVRRLLGFATPLPPLLTSLAAACGSLHLAVITRGGTFTRKNRAMPGTPCKNPAASLTPPGLPCGYASSPRRKTFRMPQSPSISRISASRPGRRLPFRSAIPMDSAGCREAQAAASYRGTPACSR